MKFNRNKEFKKYLKETMIETPTELVERKPVGQITKLSNGLKVANFSSPHPFTFEDGSVIPAVNNNDSQRLKVNFNETIIDTKVYDYLGALNTREFNTISLDFTLSQEVDWEIEVWYKMWKHNDVDIVLCPLPMIQALQKTGDDLQSLLSSPFRAIRMKDRIKKLISIDTFTI